MKNKFITFLILLFAAVNFNTAFAQSAKLKKPLTSSENDMKLTVCYDISGLGNVTSVTITMSYAASVETECTNPGGNIAPGQSGSYPSSAEQFDVPVHNGRAAGCITSTKVFPAGKCPNSKWDGAVTDVTFSNISLSVLGKTFITPNP